MATAARAVARVWTSKDSVWSPEDRDSSVFAELRPLNTAFSFGFFTPTYPALLSS